MKDVIDDKIFSIENKYNIKLFNKIYEDEEVDFEDFYLAEIESKANKYDLIKKENKQLKDILYKIKKYICSEFYCFDNESTEFNVAKIILDKINELERSDNNEKIKN